jgi:hypothetical protein
MGGLPTPPELLGGALDPVGAGGKPGKVGGKVLGSAVGNAVGKGSDEGSAGKLDGSGIGRGSEPASDVAAGGRFGGDAGLVGVAGLAGERRSGGLAGGAIGGVPGSGEAAPGVWGGGSVLGPSGVVMGGGRGGAAGPGCRDPTTAIAAPIPTRSTTKSAITPPVRVCFLRGAGAVGGGPGANGVIDAA